MELIGSDRAPCDVGQGKAIQRMGKFVILFLVLSLDLFFLAKKVVFAHSVTR